MALNKIFLPPESKIDGDVLVLKSGAEVPLWAVIGVPVEESQPTPGGDHPTTSDYETHVDLLTGATRQGKPVSPRRADVGGETSDAPISFDEFSRWAPLRAVLRVAEESMPDAGPLGRTAVFDPGYTQSSGSKPTAGATVGEDDDWRSPDYALGAGFTVADFLVYLGRPQVLTPQAGLTALEITKNAVSLATDVLAHVPETHSFSVRSWYAVRAQAPSQPDHWTGAAAALVFTSDEHAYSAAKYLSTTASFDSIRLDYGSDGKSSLHVYAPAGGSRLGKLSTSYAGTVVSGDRLIRAVRGTTAYAASGDSPTVSLPESDGDDYWALFHAISSRPEVFGGVASARTLLQALGFPSNITIPGVPTLGPPAGGAAAVAAAVVCPQESSSASSFPIASVPAFRRLQDVTQLSDSNTQDTIPFTVRTNNPLRVPTVAGVTDLRTRFGYLGDAGGVAVFRDHVGGAAAGLAYMSSVGSGMTAGGFLRTALGDFIRSADAADITGLTPAKAFQNFTSILFGIADPTGAMADCSVVTPDQSERSIRQAAAVAAVLADSEKSPLTLSEWKSAYQIHKNEPNGHLTKTTTGVDLPAQEKTEAQLTGSSTQSQGMETSHTVDAEARGDAEKWNPVASWDHYSQDRWGPDGSNWIADGIVSYERKTSEADKIKMAKADAKTVLSQDPKLRTDYVDLDWSYPEA